MSEIPMVAARSAVKLHPRGRSFHSDVSTHIPTNAPGVIDLETMAPLQVDGIRVDLVGMWERAAPLLAIRDNDAHSLYALGIAASLAAALPEADPVVALPAILLHDIGWSQVPPDEVLAAIAPGGGRPDLVRMHEVEGARLAQEILVDVGHDAAAIARIVEIIDGHDSRVHALSIEDAIVKDSDKTWRVTPHGLDVVMEWFGLERHEALSLCASRVIDHLFTDPARALARGLVAMSSVTMWPQSAALGED
ncbi:MULTISPECIES: HD domain-containing protein [Microbacterium]|uniref:HD domain-containing protein n=1 Tax=Microbacterium TaxID=33882 RepID=UPI001E3585BB|nr:MULTISPECIES: HD domain-containing protein [Microbacterium]MDO8382028.1 HD domain-containing protein [Microbacterium sp.]